MLVVTELPFLGITLSRLLTECGWSVTVAGGRDHLQELLEGGAFDLVMLDIEVGYPAVEAAAWTLRTRAPETRLAILLGWWDNRAADMRQWSDLFVYKPVHPDQLRQTLRAVAAE